MAQKVQVVLTCDLDDAEVTAAETVTFGFDGSSYVFELCQRHLKEFNETMEAYIASARAADRPRRRRGAGSSTRSRQPSVASVASTPSNIRTWARDNGYDVSDRGRIPADVRAAFEAAN